MEKELLLLRKLQLNPKITQRDMAKATGLSLGSVNTIIKRMIKIGILKVEKRTQKTIMYNLTSLGIKQKAEGMYKYMCEICSFLIELNTNIDNLLSSINNDNIVVLFGEKDDFSEVIRMKVKKKGTQCIITDSCEEIKYLSENNKFILIVWKPENIKTLSELNYSYIDLLQCI